MRPRIAIDVHELRLHVARNERFYAGVGAALAATHQTSLRICYEDLWSPDQRARLLRFLDVTPEGVSLEPRSVKQNPRDLRAIVENFDELAQALRGDPLGDELLDFES